MNLLLIDTCSPTLYVGVRAGEKRAEIYGDGNAKRHSATVLEAVDEVLNRMNLTPQEIDVVGVVVGPGSFTGIRIGVATANAFAAATGARMIEMTSLEVSAQGEDDVIALIDCRHGNYYAMIRRAGKDIYAAMTAEEVKATDLKPIESDRPDGEKIYRTAMQKIGEEAWCTTAHAFYLKQSSAER